MDATVLLTMFAGWLAGWFKCMNGASRGWVVLRLAERKKAPADWRGLVYRR